MTKVYLGLGSNLNNPQLQIKQAILLLTMVPASELTNISSLYQSKPIGPQNQPNYINAVAELYTELTAHILLNYLQSIENKQQRIRKERWGARTLDIDILLYDDQIINDDCIQIPHAEMHKRCFVLLPLYELAGDIEIPNIGTVHYLLQQINTSDVKKLNIRI